MATSDKPPPSQEAHASMSAWLRLSQNGDFTGHFHAWIDARIEAHRLQLEHSILEDDLHRTQGHVKELRAIKTEIKARFAEAQNNLT